MNNWTNPLKYANGFDYVLPFWKKNHSHFLHVSFHFLFPHVCSCEYVILGKSAFLCFQQVKNTLTIFFNDKLTNKKNPSYSKSRTLAKEALRNLNLFESVHY